MKRLSLVLMVLLAVVVAAPVQAVQLDSMDNIAARPWTDARGPGWLSQANWPDTAVAPPTASPAIVVNGEGTGGMKIDYGVTGVVPDPCSGYDYLGNFVGVGAAGGAFDVAGNYKGSYDREIVGNWAPGAIPSLLATDAFKMDVYKSVAGYSEHVREIQLYDGLGARNTYSVTLEPDADKTPQGWSEYSVYIKHALENNADLTDIVQIRFFVSAWSAYVSGPGDPPVWPDDYTLVSESGTPVYIDDLRLVPEPATIAMLSLGGLALLRRRKKA